MIGESGSKPCSRRCSGGGISLAPAIHGRGQFVDLVRRQAQGLGDVAHRAASAVADHDGGQRGAFAAVAVEDVLQHFLAALVLEVDVDVRRLVALLRHEALEQQFHLRRAAAR